ncbi:MAG: BMP family ABC transporter substrate-binding protein, partial [Clostridia bacterium]|nr:BMP family ABC transporter substrate-binding protein [Clostridia bacterium]
MKKVLSLVLAVAVIATLCIALVACGETSTASVNEIVIPEYTGTVPADFKFGLITLHDDASTYDKNFIDAAKTAAQMIGLSDSQLIIRSGVEEGAECTTVANELVEQGCKVIMADSFGHESYLMEAAKLHK